MHKHSRPTGVAASPSWKSTLGAAAILLASASASQAAVAGAGANSATVPASGVAKFYRLKK